MVDTHINTSGKEPGNFWRFLQQEISYLCISWSSTIIRMCFLECISQVIAPLLCGRRMAERLPNQQRNSHYTFRPWRGAAGPVWFLNLTFGMKENEGTLRGHHGKEEISTRADSERLGEPSSLVVISSGDRAQCVRTWALGKGIWLDASLTGAVGKWWILSLPFSFRKNTSQWHRWRKALTVCITKSEITQK
jgi:hypothetical protein